MNDEENNHNNTNNNNNQDETLQTIRNLQEKLQAMKTEHESAFKIHKDLNDVLLFKLTKISDNVGQTYNKIKHKNKQVDSSFGTISTNDNSTNDELYDSSCRS